MTSPAGGYRGWQGRGTGAKGAEGVVMAAETGRPVVALPRSRQVRLAAGFGPVATGWVMAVGALVFEFGIPAWTVAAVGVEATVGVALASVILTRSAALLAWLTAATALATGWVAYAAAAGPFTWAGEVSLVLPAAILALLWPTVHARAVRRLR